MLSAQQSVYMMVDSINGDQVAPHNREFKLNSFSFATTNSMTISTATGGAGASKAAFGAVKISMRLNAATTPAFHKHLVAGTRLPSIEIRLYNATNRVFYKTVFESAYLTSITTEGADESVQTIEFVYIRARWVMPADPAAGASEKSACWDIVLNRSC